MKRRNDMPDDEAFRLWLRALFKENPEFVSDAVAILSPKESRENRSREQENSQSAVRCAMPVFLVRLRALPGVDAIRRCEPR
jgi:hypothetical protein